MNIPENELEKELLIEEINEVVGLLEKGTLIDCGDGLYQINARKEIELRKKLRNLYTRIFGDDTRGESELRDALEVLEGGS